MNTRRVAVLTALVLSLFLTACYSRAADDPPARQSSKASLGIFVEPTPPNAEHPGVIVREAPPDSPAAKAGMKTGDIIVKADNKDVKAFNDLANALAKHKPGDKVAFHVLRNGQDQSLTATLGETAIRTATRDDRLPQQRGNAFLGIQMQELTPEAKTRLGVTADHGTVVSEVVPNTPAEKAGLRPGDVIISAAGHDLDNPARLRDAVRKAGPGQEITLKVMRGKEMKEVKAQLEEAPGDALFQPPFELRRDMTPGRPEMRAPSIELRRLEQQVERLEKRVQELERKVEKQPK